MVKNTTDKSLMEQYSQYPDTFYRVSLKAVIRNQNDEILVVREGGDDWDLPGGGWEHGESEREALSRELKEEVGYDGPFDMVFRATRPTYMTDRESWRLWIVYDVFMSDIDAEDFSVGVDAAEIAWMKPIDFKDRDYGVAQWIYKNLV